MLGNNYWKIYLWLKSYTMDVKIIWLETKQIPLYLRFSCPRVKQKEISFL